LGVPSKTSEGGFRVLCPICNEFQPGINPNVNLVRCFRCERNFNASDLVIEVHGCSFKESVVFLKQLLGQLSNQDKNSSDHGREVQVCNRID
jgi:DNA primase